jgi:hypothetical protein
MQEALLTVVNQAWIPAAKIFYLKNCVQETDKYNNVYAYIPKYI